MPFTGEEEEVGTFYLDPTGLQHVYPNLEDWGLALVGYLKGRGFHSRVVIADGRYRAFSLAKTSCAAVRCYLSRATADSDLRKLALEELHLTPHLRTALSQLALRTVGELLAINAGELTSRLGPEAGTLHALLSGERQLCLQPTARETPLWVHFDVEPPDADQERLLFQIKGALHGLLSEVTAQGRVLSALRLQLNLEGGPRIPGEEVPREDLVREQRIEPARGTRDVMTLVELVRLRLGAWMLSSPVVSVRLEAETEQVEGDQLRMFSCPKRDPAAANRALARLRAAFGDAAVTRPVLRDAHLPEASFAFEPVKTISFPRPLEPSGSHEPSGSIGMRGSGGLTPALAPVGSLGPVRSLGFAGGEVTSLGKPRPLIRRLLHKPIPLTSRAFGLPQGSPALRLSPEDILVLNDRSTSFKGIAAKTARCHRGPSTTAPVEKIDGDFPLFGPYRVSGGWWARPMSADAAAQPVSRDYYYAETEDGFLWLYFDHTQARWFLQGYVD